MGKSALFLLFTIVLGAIPVAAIGKSGNELLDDCRSTGSRSAYCLGYIVGIATAYNDGRIGGALHRHFGDADPAELAQRTDEVNAVRVAASYYCTPSGVTQGQLYDVVVRYLDDNPSIRHLSAGILITVALHKAFPCK